MRAVIHLLLALCVALLDAGCSGSSVQPMGVSTATPTPIPLSSLSISLSGAPSFSTAESATTYPIDLRAYGADGTLITGNYAQQVIVVLVPPSCSSSNFGLEGGVAPNGVVYYPVTTGVCSPGTDSPPSATAVNSSSTTLSLTWNGTPTMYSGELEAYAMGVPTVTFTFPAMTTTSSRR